MSGRGMNNVWAIVLSTALVYTVLSALMAVIPGITMSHMAPTPGLKPYTRQERLGRQVYVSEGCAYCHSQVVRPIREDAVYGRPSVGGDFVFQTPELLGDHRNGPDLTDIGERQPSTVWQLIHLWDPRALVNESIMPRYTWLFTVKARAAPGDVVVPVPPGFGPSTGVVVATKRALHLVDYLESLKQVPLTKSAVMK